MTDQNLPSESRRVRSPAYPNIGLKDAVDKVVVLYRREGQGRHPIPVSSIATDWGYKGVNGSAMAAVSALKQFGLLSDVPESEPRKLTLTPRAITLAIHTSPDAPERKAALKDACVLPKFYAGLLRRYPLPLPSDDTLRAHLLGDLHFNQKQVASAIKDFKASLAFAGLDKQAIIVQDDSAQSHNDAPLDDPSVFEPGDLVQWESQGVAQFTNPRRVLSVHESGDWVFVEGSTSGLPAKDVRLVTKGSPMNPNQIQSPPQFSPPPALSVPPGAKQDVFTTVEGSEVVVRWPAVLSKDDYEDLEGWLDMLKRKIKRSVQASETKDD